MFFLFYCLGVTTCGVGERVCTSFGITLWFYTLPRTLHVISSGEIGGKVDLGLIELGVVYIEKMEPYSQITPSSWTSPRLSILDVILHFIFEGRVNDDSGKCSHYNVSAINL